MPLKCCLADVFDVSAYDTDIKDALRRFYFWTNKPSAHDRTIHMQQRIAAGSHD